MGNKSSKEKADNSNNRVSGRSARKGPLPNVPCADDVILRERHKDSRDHDILTSQPQKEEFSPDAKVYLVLHDFDAIGHNTVSVLKNERVELRSQVEVWSDVYVSRLGRSGWIPSNYLAPQNSLSRYPWYHNKTTRSTAEYLLRNGINGSFLVRESESNKGQFSLSVRHEGKKFHYRIQSHAGRYWINEETKFKDLAELIHHHSLNSSGLVTTLTHPVPNETKPVLDNLNDEWEIDRDSITLGEKLGSGQYGEVYKGEWFRDKGKTAGMPIAVKTLKMDSASQEEFMKEAALMKVLKHDNLLHLLGVCTLQKPFFIITEYMPLGNLLEYIRKFKEQVTSEALLHAANQIAAGMCFLEKANLVHRDLACRNCLVGENLTIRICDFGLSRLLDEDSYTAREGTKFPIKWTAPEALNYNTFTMKSDVWSFGIVLWELATQGDTPYPSIDLQDVLGLLETGYRMKRPDGCPEKVYKLMRDCWEWQPESRPTFLEITSQIDNMFSSSSVEEEVQKTLEEDIVIPDQQPSTSSASSTPSQRAANPLLRALSPRSNRSKSAPLDPAILGNLTKERSISEQRLRGLDMSGLMRSPIRPSHPSPSRPSHPTPPPRHQSPSGLPPPQALYRGQFPEPARNNFYPQGNHPQGNRPQGNHPQGNRPQGNHPQGQPRYPPGYQGQGQPVSYGGKRHHPPPKSMSSPRLPQQCVSSPRQPQQSMSSARLPQQQLSAAQLQHLQHQQLQQMRVQQQELWLRQQQAHLAQNHARQHAHNQHMLAQAQAQKQSAQAKKQSQKQQAQKIVQHKSRSSTPRSNCESKPRSSSECSSASSASGRAELPPSSGRCEPPAEKPSSSPPGSSHSAQSSVSSTSGTDLLSELKFRQSRRGDGPRNGESVKNGDPPAGKPPSTALPPPAGRTPPTAIPQKPLVPSLRQSNGSSSPLFCAVNPAKAKESPRPGSKLEEPAGRDSPAEDFSFEAILQRAKGIEKKGNTLTKPKPPPKPKINLT